MMLRIPHCVDNLLTDGGNVVIWILAGEYRYQLSYWFVTFVLRRQ
jgi:hypothetical protein